MRYFIDGYNLFFRFNKDANDFSKQRQLMIDELNWKMRFLKIEATVVFDSQYQRSPGSRSFFHDIEVIFTDEGETADDRILEEIKAIANPRNVTVVTSDKKLAWFARRCEAKTESVEVFSAWLNKRYENKKRQKPADKKAAKKASKKIEPTSSTLEPQPNAKPEECNDYYLTLFEERLATLPPIESHKKHHPVRAGKKKSRPKGDNKENFGLSDVARWRQIFEQKLKGDEDKEE